MHLQAIFNKVIHISSNHIEKRGVVSDVMNEVLITIECLSATSIELKQSLGKFFLAILIDCLITMSYPHISYLFRNNLVLSYSRLETTNCLIEHSSRNKALLTPVFSYSMGLLKKLYRTADGHAQILLIEILWRLLMPNQKTEDARLAVAARAFSIFGKDKVAMSSLITSFAAIRPNDFRKTTRSFMNKFNDVRAKMSSTKLRLVYSFYAHKIKLAKHTFVSSGDHPLWIDMGRTSLTIKVPEGKQGDYLISLPQYCLQSLSSETTNEWSHFSLQFGNLGQYPSMVMIPSIVSSGHNSSQNRSEENKDIILLEVWIRSLNSHIFTRLLQRTSSVIEDSVSVMTSSTMPSFGDNGSTPFEHTKYRLPNEYLHNQGGKQEKMSPSWIDSASNSSKKRIREDLPFEESPYPQSAPSPKTPFANPSSYTKIQGMNGDSNGPSQHIDQENDTSDNQCRISTISTPHVDHVVSDRTSSSGVLVSTARILYTPPRAPHLHQIPVQLQTPSSPIRPSFGYEEVNMKTLENPDKYNFSQRDVTNPAKIKCYGGEEEQAEVIAKRLFGSFYQADSQCIPVLQSFGHGQSIHKETKRDDPSNDHSTLYLSKEQGRVSRRQSLQDQFNNFKRAFENENEKCADLMKERMKRISKELDLATCEMNTARDEIDANIGRVFKVVKLAQQRLNEMGDVAMGDVVDVSTRYQEILKEIFTITRKEIEI